MPKPETTPFDDSIDSTANDSEGDEVPYDRTMVIGELLALEFDDDQPYTHGELDKMNDDDLIDLYNSEMFPGADAPPNGIIDDDDADEEVECSVCGVTKVCDFEDEDGEPICADCEEDGDDEEVESADEILESETDEEEEEDGEESSDDVDETEES